MEGIGVSAADQNRRGVPARHSSDVPECLHVQQV